MSEVFNKENLEVNRKVNETQSPVRKRSSTSAHCQVKFSTPQSSYLPRKIMSERELRRTSVASLVSEGFTTPLPRAELARGPQTSPRKKPAEQSRRKSFAGLVSSTPIRVSTYSREMEALEKQHRLASILKLKYPVCSKEEIERRVHKYRDTFERKQQERIARKIAERDEQWRKKEERFAKKCSIREQKLKEINAELQDKTQKLSIRVEQLEKQLEKEDKWKIQHKIDQRTKKLAVLERERELADKEAELMKLPAYIEELEKGLSTLQQQKEKLQQSFTEERIAAEAQLCGLRKQDKERLDCIRELVQNNEDKQEELGFLRGKLEQIENLKMEEYDGHLKKAAGNKAKLKKESKELSETLAAIQLRIQDKEATIANLKIQLKQMQGAIKQQAVLLEDQQQIIAQLRKENAELQLASSAQPTVLSLETEMLELRVEELQQQLNNERAGLERDLEIQTRRSKELKKELESTLISFKKTGERNVLLSKENVMLQEIFGENLRQLTIVLKEEQRRRAECEQILKLLVSSSPSVESEFTRESIIANSESRALLFSNPSSSEDEESSSLNMAAILQENDDVEFDDKVQAIKNQAVERVTAVRMTVANL